MAWRIDEAVIDGEIDNRVRGLVTGTLRLAGFDEPIQLELKGNAWRDLAGRRLRFVNPAPKPAGDLASLGKLQSGAAGDLTASRKVKVPDIPLNQIGEYYAQRKPWTWHWGNSLYLEWFSEENGRVVIEAVGFELTISSDAAWEMTPEEEVEQRKANAEAAGNFMQRIGASAVEALSDLTEPDRSEDASYESGHEWKHPLTERSHELSMRLRQDAREQGWLPADAGEEHPVLDLSSAVARASAKFASALSTEQWPPDEKHGTHALVRLKQARSYLEDGLLAAEYCEHGQIGDAVWLGEARRELNALADECDMLIAELRTLFESEEE